MEVDYSFPGSIDITLNVRDLQSLQELGYSVERDGFSGIDSKTWVHLPPISTEPSHPNIANAIIEAGGDLHVYLNRGFPLPITVEQSCIEANGGLVEHFLGKAGVINVVLENS